MHNFKEPMCGGEREIERNKGTHVMMKEIEPLDKRSK